MKLALMLGALAGAHGLSGCANLPKLALSQDTLTPQEHVSLGNAYLANKEKKLAVAQFKAAIKQDGRFAPALLALGNLAFQDKELGKARSFFQKALDAAPTDAAAMNNLAMVELAEGKLERAVRLAEDALPTAGPLKPYVLDTLANIAVRDGRYQDARRFLDQAAAEAPKGDAEFEKHLEESRQNLATAGKK